MSCHAPLESPIGCLACHTIFPPSSSLNHFERLGLPKTYALDLDDLERRFLLWSRELHPDFHQLKPSEEQSLSLKLSAALNDAYSTLKDPFRRAEYLLHLLGGPTASEQREMPPEFLEEVLELRMEIAEAHADGDPESPSVKALQARLERDRRQALERVAQGFADVDRAGKDGVRQEKLVAIRQELNTIKYLDGLLRDLRQPAHQGV